LGGGKKQYEVVAVVDGDSVGRFGLRIEETDEGGDERTASNSHSLNDAAVDLVKQSQNHVEGLLRAVVGLVVGTEKTRMAEMERLAQRNDALEAKFDLMRSTIEQAQDKQFDREMKREEFKSQERRLDQLFATGRTVLPFAVNALAKKNLLPTGDNSLLKEALKPMMSELTEGQLDALRKILTPAQQVSLLEVWTLLNEEKNPNGTKASP
jgi:hypothetical protein